MLCSPFGTIGFSLSATIRIRKVGRVTLLNVEITLANGSPGEVLTRRVLLEFMHRYDLTPWNWARNIHIDRDLKFMGQCLRQDGEFVIRIRSGRAEMLDPDMPIDLDRWPMLLSVYIHEQLHAYLDLRNDAVQAALPELQRLYPDVPVGGTEGARSEFSTYLHLLLCTLEIDSVAQLIGMERARALRTEAPFYRFIYDTVLRDTAQLRNVIRQYNLELPESEEISVPVEVK